MLIPFLWLLIYSGVRFGSMGKELLYLINKRLEHCCSFDDVLDEWERIMEEIIVYHDTYLDNYKPVTSNEYMEVLPVD